MVAISKGTAVLNEIKTALGSITTSAGYNYDYGTVVRGIIEHGSLASDIYPVIEIRQLNKDDEILANRTFRRSINVYIIVTMDTSSDIEYEDKEDIVEKMKQDVLNRLSEALVNCEFIIIEHIEPTREEDAITSENKIQGGIAVAVSFQHLYNQF